LGEAASIISKRSQAFFRYYESLKDLEKKGSLQLPCLREGTDGNGHIFFIVAPDAAQSGRLIQHLKSKGIDAIMHYVALHSSKAG